MKKGQNSKKNKQKLIPVAPDDSKNEFQKIQKSLDEREQILIAQFTAVQQTLEWAAHTLDSLVEKHKKLVKNRSFQNESEIEQLEERIRFFLKRIEMEQKNGAECHKKEVKFKKDREKFILSQLGNRLANIIPINP
jgi:Zn-dependent M32 family carboxypeptidase